MHSEAVRQDGTTEDRKNRRQVLGAPRLGEDGAQVQGIGEVFGTLAPGAADGTVLVDSLPDQIGSVPRADVNSSQ